MPSVDGFEGVLSQADTSIDIQGTVRSANGYVDLLGTPTIVIYSDDLFAGDLQLDAGTDITIEATEYLELQGLFGYGNGEFQTSYPDAVAWDGGALALFDGETGEHWVE